MQRVLVTGADGFTGRHLCRLLTDHGYEVHALAHEAPEAPPPNAAWQAVHIADLIDVRAVTAAVTQVDPTHVVHLAAIAFVAHDDVDGLYRTNIVGTRNLLAALASLPRQPQTVLLASSANVYGNARSGKVNETTSLEPANDYAVSKLAMESMARLWKDKLPLVVVRPFNYTGRGQSANFLVAKIVAHFARRAPFIELGNLDVERDFSDVRVVAEAYRRLLRCGRVGSFPVYNVCTGMGLTLRQIVDMAADISGHALEIRVNPVFVRANEVKRLVGDPSLLQQRIGDLSLRPFDETLAWMLADDDDANPNR